IEETPRVSSLPLATSTTSAFCPKKCRAQAVLNAAGSARTLAGCFVEGSLTSVLLAFRQLPNNHVRTSTDRPNPLLAAVARLGGRLGFCRSFGFDLFLTWCAH